MDRFCSSGVGHQSCFCLKTGTHSSRMEMRTGTACSNEDMSISHAKDCWLNFYLSPLWLVPAEWPLSGLQGKLQVLLLQALSGLVGCLQRDCVMCGRSHSPSAGFAASLTRG